MSLVGQIKITQWFSSHVYYPLHLGDLQKIFLCHKAKRDSYLYLGGRKSQKRKESSPNLPFFLCFLFDARSSARHRLEKNIFHGTAEYDIFTSIPSSAPSYIPLSHLQHVMHLPPPPYIPLSYPQTIMQNLRNGF